MLSIRAKINGEDIKVLADGEKNIIMTNDGIIPVHRGSRFFINSRKDQRRSRHFDNTLSWFDSVLGRVEFAKYNGFSMIMKKKNARRLVKELGLTGGREFDNECHAYWNPAL